MNRRKNVFTKILREVSIRVNKEHDTSLANNFFVKIFCVCIILLSTGKQDQSQMVSNKRKS